MVLTGLASEANTLTMFERFSAYARHAIVLAQEEARGLNQNYIGTEHLLLGLLAENQGMAARALDSVGVTLDATRLLIIKDVGRGTKTPEGHIPFTPRAKKTLELALREALALQHNYIGTEHLLLGQLRLDDGLGAKLLDQQGVDNDTLRQATLDLLGTAQADQRPRWRRLLESRPDTAIDDMRTTRAADESLEKARRLAGAEAVGSQHLLLAALSDPTSAAAKALGDLNIDLDTARLALSRVDITGTSDELPEQAGRHLIEIRLDPEALVLSITDDVLIEQARRTLAVLDPPTRESGIIPGDLDVCASLADVWKALNLSLKDIQRRASHAQSTIEPGAEASPT